MHHDEINQAISRCLSSGQTIGRVTVALSGGLDSMVLLDATHRIQQAFSANNATNSAPIMALDAVHVHHGLSPNADDWAKFCQVACDARGISLKVARVHIDRTQTEGQGVEAAARRARHAVFADSGAPLILAGHHADDQAETVLHQLLRGTGLAGMAAMGEMRRLSTTQWLRRPLLSIPQAVLAAYAQDHALTWVEDESNADTAYTRNFIRHQLLPLIGARFPHYAASLARAAKHAADSVVMQEALAKIDLQWDGATARAEKLDDLDLPRQANALYHWLRWLDVTPPSHAMLETWAGQLFRASPTDKPHQAGGHDFVIRRKHGVLTLASLAKTAPQDEGESAA